MSMFSFLTTKLSRKYLDTAIAPFASAERTLDIGARGEAEYTRYFPNRVGLDIVAGPGVDVIASVYELPFRDGEFSRVLCMSVLEHLTDPRRAVREMHRVVAPGGQLIVSVPFLFPMHDAPGDYWRFTASGLRELFADGWEIAELRAETNEQEALAVLLQRYAFQSRFYANWLMKPVILLAARILALLPRFARSVHGDIRKKTLVPEAFASAFFLVALRK